jgi:cell wall-associated NlpC family hydrolase
LTCAKRQLGASRSSSKFAKAIGFAVAAAFCIAPAPALANSGGIGIGGTGSTPPATGVTTPGTTAKLKNGYAIPPADAPPKVQRAIAAANEIVKGKPYCLGGGHERRKDTCYDCSGSVSYALTGAGLLDYAMPSGSFMRWEEPGRGRWITTYANSGHIYAVIAGLRLDTSMTVGDGPGWSEQMRSAKGYSIRHPARF